MRRFARKSSTPSVISLLMVTTPFPSVRLMLKLMLYTVLLILMLAMPSEPLLLLPYCPMLHMLLPAPVHVAQVAVAHVQVAQVAVAPVHLAPVAAHAVAHSVTKTVKHACREVKTQHCVDNPKAKNVPVEIEQCHVVTKV